MCNTTAICFYILALVFGLFALFLPYWASGDIERVKNVTVVKEIDSGIFNEHYSYHMKDDPNSFEISGTFFYPEVVKTVKILMIIGLCLLSIALIHWVYRCSCYRDDKIGKTLAKVSLAMSIMTIIAGGFILGGLYMYKSLVIGDLESDEIRVGASWWLGLASAILTYLVGLGIFWQSVCTLCEAKSQNHEQTMSRGKHKGVFHI